MRITHSFRGTAAALIFLFVAFGLVLVPLPIAWALS